MMGLRDLFRIIMPSVAKIDDVNLKKINSEINLHRDTPSLKKELRLKKNKKLEVNILMPRTFLLPSTKIFVALPWLLRTKKRHTAIMNIELDKLIFFCFYLF